MKKLRAREWAKTAKILCSFILYLLPDYDTELSLYGRYDIILTSDYEFYRKPKPYRHTKENPPWIPAISVIF